MPNKNKSQMGGSDVNETDLNTLNSIKDLSDSINKKKDKLSDLEKRIKQLTELNENLTHGYELSLKLVVDVSKLLEDYSQVFDNIESTLTNIDQRLDGIKSGDIHEISSLTKESIFKITSDFDKQYPVIIKSLEKQNDPSSLRSAAKLKSIVNNIHPSSKLSGGSKSSKKQHESKKNINTSKKSI